MKEKSLNQLGVNLLDLHVLDEGRYVLAFEYSYDRGHNTSLGWCKSILVTELDPVTERERVYQAIATMVDEERRALEGKRYDAVRR